MSVFSITPTSTIYNQNASFIGGLQAANISSPGEISTNGRLSCSTLTCTSTITCASLDNLPTIPTFYNSQSFNLLLNPPTINIGNSATNINVNGNLSVVGNLSVAGNVSFRNLSVNTIDSITATTLSIGTSNATAINIGRGGVTTTINGPLTATGLITANGGLTMGNNITLSATPTTILTNQVGSAAGITYSPRENIGSVQTIGTTAVLPNNTVWFLQGCIGIPNLAGNTVVNINIGLSLAAQNMSCSNSAYINGASGLFYLSCSTIVIGGTNTIGYLNCSSTNVFTLNSNSIKFSAFRIA